MSLYFDIAARCPNWEQYFEQFIERAVVDNHDVTVYWQSSSTDSDLTRELRQLIKSEKWSIQGELGSGISGGVFSMKKGRLFNKKTYALKVITDKVMFENERNALKELKNISYFPQLIQCKLGLRYHCIVMSQQLCDISMMMSLMKEKKFSIMTTTKVFRDCVQALWVMHEKGLLHRDVKPSNILISMDGRRVLLSDFSHSTKYLPGEHETFVSQFIGTPIYASMNVHYLYEPTRRDDLISLFYSAVEMLGLLPWACCRSYVEVIWQKQHKLNFLRALPLNYQEIYYYLLKVAQHHCPRYDYVISQLDAVIERHSSTADFSYDWQVEDALLEECGEEILKKMKKHRQIRKHRCFLCY
ncbi:putative serine/threonine-protein kinase [Trichinella pseudospiralis]|uniref:non-specific serine/threonine protein kinase n=1 Tax=Trichinella pseudospiralis TaxID=6337 RepID=A0A0V0XU21_TRIPS|nr:putative serine/threonine-protein kinase [Trichinella pseudospiralis]